MKQWNMTADIIINDHSSVISDWLVMVFWNVVQSGIYVRIKYQHDS